MTEDDELLVEQVVGAWRPRDRDGGLRAHPAWHDLAEELREAAARAARRQRRIEAALDPDGLSTTAKAVLARIRAG
jgi:sugar phosphate isomerase/epimerase